MLDIVQLFHTFFLIADWNELFTTKCVSCGFPIEAGDRWVEALNNNYHSQCFNCTVSVPRFGLLTISLPSIQGEEQNEMLKKAGDCVRKSKEKRSVCERGDYVGLLPNKRVGRFASYFCSSTVGENPIFKVIFNF